MALKSPSRLRRNRVTPRPGLEPDRIWGIVLLGKAERVCLFFLVYLKWPRLIQYIRTRLSPVSDPYYCRNRGFTYCTTRKTNKQKNVRITCAPDTLICSTRSSFVLSLKELQDSGSFVAVLKYRDAVTAHCSISHVEWSSR